jgi:hypothetical protein
MRWAGLFIVLAVVALPAEPQSGVGGTVNGVVTRSRTGEPVSGAQVLLRHRIGPQTLTTDASGRFAFAGIPAGEIRIGLAGRKPGRFSQPSLVSERFLSITAGQTIDEVDLFLRVGGSVSGRIVTAAGQPAVDVLVEIARVGYEFGGRCAIQPVASARTDDRGLYRISDVEPGEYYVRAENARPDESANVRSRTFFPGTLDLSKAVYVTVLDEQETNRIDFGISKTAVTQVSGTIEVENPPISGSVFRLQVRSIDGCDPGTDSVFIGSSPTFRGTSDSFKGIVAGTSGAYELILSIAAAPALTQNQFMNTAAMLSGLLFSMTHSGVATIGLSSQNLGAVRVRALPLLPLSGQVRIADGLRVMALESVRAVAVFPEAAPSLMGNAGAHITVTSAGAPLSSSGSFRIQTPAGGKHYIYLEGLNNDVYIADIRSGEKSLYEDGIDQGSLVSGRIDLILDSRGGVVEGRVQDTLNRPAPFALATLVPAGQRSNPLSFRVVTTDRNGTFRFRGVRPGNYKVFAWEDVPEYAWHNKEFLAPFEDLGAEVQVRAATTSANVGVRLIPRASLKR